MIYLVCESSTLLGSVAVFNDSKLLAYKESLRQGSHSEVLNLFIQSVLDEAKIKLSEVDFFVSGTGPGSFTGIRISINTIKTFAYCFDKPVIGINSLENMAYLCPEQNKPIVCMLNAYKNMVYIATYKKEGSHILQLKAPEVVRVQNLESYVTEDSVVVGDGYTTYSQFFKPELAQKIQRLNDPDDDPKASASVPFILNNRIQPSHWSKLMPLYLRASEAEENLMGIKFQAL